MKTAILSVAAVAPIFVFAQAETGTHTVTTTTEDFIASLNLPVPTGVPSVTTDSVTITTTPTITTAPTTTLMLLSTTVSSSYINPGCGAGVIVDTCLGITTGKQLECDPADYSCQCNAYQAIET